MMFPVVSTLLNDKQIGHNKGKSGVRFSSVFFPGGSSHNASADTIDAAKGSRSEGGLQRLQMWKICGQGLWRWMHQKRGRDGLRNLCSPGSSSEAFSLQYSIFIFVISFKSFGF
ncbi:unnamed protein product [Cuscuta europaea]|uniref:Uncharacterized protein n=1 Tax=Cuscuta europaea TaxID=41803 RepID=A0A9P0YIB4_CUSEU|nr:unnamed protein product [Cuscuta europaea]